MATRNHHTAGLLPAVNDIVAILAISGVYLTRFGMLAEGVEPGLVHLPLLLTTDLVLPVAAAAWLLAVPVWQVVTR